MSQERQPADSGHDEEQGFSGDSYGPAVCAGSSVDVQRQATQNFLREFNLNTYDVLDNLTAVWEVEHDLHLADTKPLRQRSGGPKVPQSSEGSPNPSLRKAIAALQKAGSLITDPWSHRS